VVEGTGLGRVTARKNRLQESQNNWLLEEGKTIGCFVAILYYKRLFEGSYLHYIIIVAETRETLQFDFVALLHKSLLSRVFLIYHCGQSNRHQAKATVNRRINRGGRPTATVNGINRDGQLRATVTVNMH
jgi:hypothetical protein